MFSSITYAVTYVESIYHDGESSYYTKVFLQEFTYKIIKVKNNMFFIYE